jgi:hypothetical protein
MVQPNVQSQLDAVEMHTKRLERPLTFTTFGWLLTLFMLLLSAWTLRSQAAQQPKAQPEVLRVRQLVVEDDKGMARIILGSPVPDPQVRGKPSKRRNPGTGILIADASGNERAGLGILDDGSVVVGLDDELGRSVPTFISYRREVPVCSSKEKKEARKYRF